ncbi:MAG TPA: AAA family ATPase [Thermoanaerobaculia bacterium]|nr:AAA family ATPase [Thermoanaerobaculia bacterium]
MKRRRPLPSVWSHRSGPFLRGVRLLSDKADRSRYPFNVRAFSHGIDLQFRSNVTFFVGENGSGKSTLLEAIAECCGFNPEGGNRDHHFATFGDRSALASALRLAWLPKVTEGFFLRAESFYNFATYIEEVSNLLPYGGKSLHQQSHGESFLALFVNRFEQGIYLLDEPEAALSPQRQLSFLKILHDLAEPNQAQFLISTHSPILLSYPGATLYSLDGDSIAEVGYQETEHYRLTKDFLNAPERYFRTLFAAGDDEESDED